jgi:hypothetical protein
MVPPGGLDGAAASLSGIVDRRACRIRARRARVPLRGATMKTSRFDITINAPRAVVWQTMLDPDTYRQWTAAFCEGSYFTGSWEQGAAIRFLAPGGDVSIRHLGVIENGVEDTTSEKVRAWAPAYENYSFADTPAGCRVTVTLDTVPEYEAHMLEVFPKALALLKQICERRAGAGQTAPTVLVQAPRPSAP